MMEHCQGHSLIKFAISDAQASIGTDESPKDPRIAKAIGKFHADIQAQVDILEKRIWRALKLPAKLSSKQKTRQIDSISFEAEPHFEYSAAQQEQIDWAIDDFLDAMAGRDRSALGFIGSESSDGLIQQWDRFAYSIGGNRADEIAGADATKALPDRNSEGVKKMLNEAFERLSENGQLRLEGVKDDIQGMLLGAMDAGMSPIDVGRQLSQQFDAYRGWEFERLARTEVSAAQNQGQVNEFQAQGFRDATSEKPPFHPNCLCALTIDAEKNAVIYDIAATACEICQAYVGTEDL
ncbi:MAG: hypothetical protein ABFD83_14835 [Armatimonadota bacterium]